MIIFQVNCSVSIKHSNVDSLNLKEVTSLFSWIVWLFILLKRNIVRACVYLRVLIR